MRHVGRALAHEGALEIRFDVIIDELRLIDNLVTTSRIR